MPSRVAGPARKAPTTPRKDASRVCLGCVTGVHGVRGLLTVHPFTGVAEDVAAYGPVQTGSGRTLRLKIKGVKKSLLIVEAEGISDRNAAEALKGENIFAPRDALPAPDEDEWYYTDLVGLEARLAGSEVFGTVVAVENFGAGYLVEIQPAQGPTVYLPFTAAAVPEIDIAARRMTVNPPSETGDKETDDAKDAAS